MFNIAQFELIVNIVKTSQGVYALGGLFIYVMYNVKNWRCKKTALKESRFPAFRKSRLFFMPDRKNNYFG